MQYVSSAPPSDGFAAPKLTKPVNFICAAPSARNVHLSGDFNDWNPASLPMRRQPDGSWLIEVPLPHGHHQYRFVVDGRPVLDPKAQGLARGSKGERASLLAVK